MDEKQARIEALNKYGFARMKSGLEQVEPLLRFGRAFADPMRIRILVLLSERSMYGQELAEALDVAAPTISHHLTLLKAAGLIQVRRENNYHHYTLDPAGLRAISDVLTIEHLRSIGTSFTGSNAYDVPPPEDEDRKMIQDAFFQDGRLLSIPPVSRSRRFAMEKVAQAFEWGRIYDEKEVNAILKTIYPEVATLRRELIDQKLMMRENGRYWLVRPKVR